MGGNGWCEGGVWKVMGGVRGGGVWKVMGGVRGECGR